MKTLDFNRLPSAYKLRALAAWIDTVDRERGAQGNEIQHDLRTWADYIEQVSAN